MTDYTTFCGLYLNLDRIRLRRAMEVASGIGVALGERIDPAYFDAICDTEAEGAELAHEANMARQMARVRAKVGR